MGIEIISGALQTERVVSNGYRRLLRKFTIKIDSKVITVPEGMVTDYSSIPRFGRLFLRWSRVDIAGVIHDWLYKTGDYSRSEADRIWRIVAMEGDHCANGIQAWGGWVLLRLFGWYIWNKCRDDREKVGAPSI